MSQTIIGIDVSKAQFDIFVSNGQTHTCRPNTARGIKALIKDLSKLPACMVVFEATGFYHKALEKGLAHANIPYAKVNPWQARCFAQSTGKLAKTDKVDAKMLALMGQALQLDPTPLRDEVIETLGQYEIIYQALLRDKTQWSNRIKILTENKILKIANKIFKTIEKEIEQINLKTLNLIKAHPDLQERFDALVTIPGIGPRTAIALLTHMPELGTISGKKVAALAGIAPMQRQSGTHEAKAHIRAGRAAVRKALYMPSLVAMRYNQDLKIFYQRLVEAGKPKKVAIVALMRKLLTMANALLRENRKWQKIAP